MSTHHKDAHENDNNMHEVKGFPSSSIGYYYQKTIRGVSEWVRSFRLPNVISTANGYDAPLTEVDQDVYSISSPELDNNGIVWQSATTVRFTFSGGYDSSLYATGSYLIVTGETTEDVHNGVWEITTVNASYLEVTNAAVTDGANDVASASDSIGYVIHEDFDPENLGNGQSIPMKGIVKYYENVDLWFGNSFQAGDEYYDESLSKKTIYNGITTNEESGIFSVKVPLTAAQIKTGSSVPIDAVEAPGSGYAIEVISGSVSYVFNTVAFTSNIFLLNTDTSTTEQMLTGFIQNAVTSSFKTFNPTLGNTGNQLQLIDNKKITITTNADSATGDSTATIYITYRIIKL